MTWVDGAVLAVLALSAIIAFSRGLVHEVLGIGAWIGALLLAVLAQPHLHDWVMGFIQPPWLADAAIFGGVFLVTLILLKVVIARFSRIVQNSALGGVDRALGIVFGLARGAFIVILLYVVAGLFLPSTDRWPEPVREARAFPYVADGARQIVGLLPADYRPRLPETTTRAAPGMDDLLRPPARNRT